MLYIVIFLEKSVQIFLTLPKKICVRDCVYVFAIIHVYLFVCVCVCVCVCVFYVYFYYF